MDNYQAVYDAVRSRFHGCDVGSAVETAAREAFDFSYHKDVISQEACVAFAQIGRPSAVYRPAIYPDGDMWCALYGANLQEGVAGFGPTPAEAMDDFDKQWREQRLRRKAPARQTP